MSFATLLPAKWLDGVSHPLVHSVLTATVPLATTALIYALGGLYSTGLWALIAGMLVLFHHTQREGLFYHFHRTTDTQVLQSLIGVWLIKQISLSLLLCVILALIFFTLGSRYPYLSSLSLIIPGCTLLFTHQLVAFLSTCFIHQKRPKTFRVFAIGVHSLTLTLLCMVWLAHPQAPFEKALWAMSLANTMMCVVGLSLLGIIHIDAGRPQKALASIKPTGQTLRALPLAFMLWLPHDVVMVALLSRFSIETAGWVYLTFQCLNVLPGLTNSLNLKLWKIIAFSAMPLLLSPLIHNSFQIPQSYSIALWAITGIIVALQYLQRRITHSINTSTTSRQRVFQVYWRILLLTGVLALLPWVWMRAWTLLFAWLVLEFTITGLLAVQCRRLSSI